MSRPSGPWVLAVDVGGTKTALAAVGPEGEILERRTAPTRTGGDDVERVAALVAEAVADWGAPLAVGTGWPEYVTAEGRLTSREVLTWVRQPAEVLAELPGLVGRPVVVESDVRLGALGEARFGAGRGARSMLYISLGTGLSSTLVLGSAPWSGARGEAIGFGEWPVPAAVGAAPAPRPTLEPFASGAGMAARYAEVTGAVVTTRDLVTLAAQGDEPAAVVLDSGAEALGLGMAALVAVLDPAVVVLGGGLGTSGAPFLGLTRRTYAVRLASRPSAPALLAATTGPDAGLLGAAAAAFDAASV